MSLAAPEQRVVPLSGLSALHAALSIERPETFTHKSAFVVFGARKRGREVGETLQGLGKEVAAYIDHRAVHLGSISGVPCLEPTSEKVGKYKSLPVVFGTFGGQTSSARIKSDLVASGFREVISYPLFYRFCGNKSQPAFWLSKEPDVALPTERLERALQLLQDETSQRIFTQVIAYRISCLDELLPKSEPQHHYRPIDLPSPREPMRLIDGGAFIGDTLSKFLDDGLNLGACACFEPDPINFGKLQHRLSQLKKLIPDVRTFQCALTNSTRPLHFSMGRGTSSSVDDHAACVVDGVTIDVTCPDFSPTMIKLDIEGLEQEALLGARQTISESRPSLAVSAYHHPADLWEIPLLLERLAADYSLHLRYHGNDGFELVVYAFPRG